MNTNIKKILSIILVSLVIFTSVGIKSFAFDSKVVDQQPEQEIMPDNEVTTENTSSDESNEQKVPVPEAPKVFERKVEVINCLWYEPVPSDTNNEENDGELSNGNETNEVTTENTSSDESNEQKVPVPEAPKVFERTVEVTNCLWYEPAPSDANNEENDGAEESSEHEGDEVANENVENPVPNLVPEKEIVSVGHRVKNTIEPELPTNLKAWKGQSAIDLRLPVNKLGTWRVIDSSYIFTDEGEVQVELQFTPFNEELSSTVSKVTVEVLVYSSDEEAFNLDNKLDVAGKDLNETESMISKEEGVPFDDVSDSDWYYDSIKYVFENMILQGVSESSFDPNFDVTRAMIISALYNMEDVIESKDSPVSFEDVVEGSYYEDAAKWGLENGIVLGDGTLFNPNLNSTREQVITMLFRYCGYKGFKSLESSPELYEYDDFSDVSLYAREAMKWALSEGILVGRNDNCICPKEPLTRAEFAMILYRLKHLDK